MRRLVVLALALTLASRAAIADGNPSPLAEPTDEVGREHLRRGRAAYKLQRWDEAIKEFEAGVYISDDAIWLWNLGQAHRMAGHCKEAVWAYERFTNAVRNTPEAARHVALATGFISDCRRAIEKADEASTRPPTSLDGKADTPAPKAPEPAEVVVHEPPVVVERPVMVVRPRWFDDTFGWSLAGGAALVAGAGVGLHLSARGLADDAAHASTQSDQVDLQDRANHRATEGTIVLVGAGAIAITAVVRLVLVPEPQTIQFEAGPTHVGIRGTF